MYMVYWTVMENGLALPQSHEFDSSDMGTAMKFMEDLRARQREGGPECFITMCSENPHSVGHPGVADPHPDYHWKKRRK